MAALLLLLGLESHAQQAWRPFRPGLIYTYEVPNATGGGINTAEGIYTLRLDSAYRTAAGDSAWAFNRVLRETTGLSPGRAASLFASQFRKSRNNLFGQRLLWQPGSADYTLESVTEGGVAAGATLLLRPRVPVASTWVANAARGITATLTSRGAQLVSGQPDTVATITLSTGPVVRLSRQYGLLEGPQWLALDGSPTRWVATQLPATLAQSAYNPAKLFDLQPGDELGYINDPITFNPIPCPPTYILRRIMARQQTSDSLIFTVREQSVITTSGAPGCNGGGVPGTVYSAIRTFKWALSLRTGQLGQFISTPLLAGEYRESAGAVDVGYGGVQTTNSSAVCGGSQVLLYERLNRNANNSGTFVHFIDVSFRASYSAVLGLGPISSISTYLTYYRRTRNGTTTTCGSAAPFAMLLPSRAAVAATVASLHPNPAAEATTLTLAQPARPGAVLRLTDALGRLVWSAPLAAGQLAATVPLAGQPAGLYLLRLSQPGAAGASWKLLHE